MRKNPVFFGWRVLLLALLLVACGAEGDGDLLVSAKDYLQKKELKAATIQLKNLLQKNPSSAEARFLLGKALYAQDDAAGAEIELKRALELKHPQSAVAPVMAGVLMARQEFKKLTERYADLELGDKAADAELQSLVALAFAAQNLPDKARAAIVKALALAPQSPPVLLANARIKANGLDFDGALAALGEMLALAPLDFDGLQLKGYLLLHGKKDAIGAIAAYKQALAIRPDNAQLHSTLISLYFSQRETQAAAEQFEALKKANPEHPLTKFYDAQITFARGDFARTRELAQGMLRAAPTNPALLHLAGAAELRLDALSQAETYLTQAVQLQPQFAAARSLLAQVYLRTDRPTKAMSVLRPMLDRPGVEAETLTLAGRAQLLADDAKAADALFRRAAALRPGDSTARAALALLQLSKGNADTAFSELQSIADSDNGVGTNMALISARINRREFDAALRAIADLEKKQPTSPIAADLRGWVNLMRGDFSGARKSFEQAVALKPSYVPAVIKLGGLDLIEKKPQAAEARVKNLLRVDPKSVQGWLALADLKRRSGGTPEDVAKLMGEAVNASPTDPEPRLALIAHHTSRGDGAAALTAAQAGVTAIPLSAELQDRLARTLMASGDLNRASVTFGSITSQQSDSPLGYQGLAEINVTNRDFATAAKNSKRALELAPNSLAAQQISIIVAMNQKRPKDALALAGIIQAQRANDALGFILEGDIEADQKRWDRAAAAFRKALGKSNPAQAPLRLHDMLMAAKKDVEAVKFADAWAATHPKDMLFQAYLAEWADNHGDSALAEKRYRMMLKLEPENPVALNNLAWLLIKQKRPGAVALAERALKGAPNQLILMDTLAMALSSENQHSKAIELQKQVLARSPEAPVFLLTMAKIYLQAGDKVLAKAALGELSKLKKAFPGSEEVAPLIKAVGES